MSTPVKQIKLSNVLTEIIDKTEEDGKYRVLTSSQSGIVSQEEYFNKKVASRDTSGYKIIRKGQFTYRAMSDTGRFYINRLDDFDIGIVSPAYPVFEIKDDNEVSSDYLTAFFKSEKFQSDIAHMYTGSTRASLKFKNLRDVVINVPDKEEQKKRLNVLRIIDRELSILGEIENKLDDSVKSRFIEMFGTLEKPKENYPQDCLENLCRKITDGKHGGCTRVEGSGRWFVGAREIYDDAVHYETAPEIDVDEFAKDYRRCNIEKGDFLIVNTGATIGKSAIASDDRTECTLLQKSVALLKVKTDILDPVFLKYCYAVNERMYRIGDGSAQPNLLLSKINKTEIYVPPLVKQNEFGMFVKEIDKSKLAIYKIKKHVLGRRLAT